MKIVKCKINSGFSLVELIFAVILLSVIVFGVVKLQTSNLALTNTNKNELQAHFLANEGAEIVEAIGYDEISDGSGPCPGGSCSCALTDAAPYSLACVDKPAVKPPQVIDGLFERTVEVDSDGLTDAYKITVLIEWTDSTGEHRREVDSEIVNAHAEAKRIIF